MLQFLYTENMRSIDWQRSEEWLPLYRDWCDGKSFNALVKDSKSGSSNGKRNFISRAQMSAMFSHNNPETLTP